MFNLDIFQNIWKYARKEAKEPTNMKRLPNNILPKFEQKTGIRAKFISAYLSNIDPVRPGRERCILLAKASVDLGYDFTASDWMFNPQKIKTALSNKAINQKPTSKVLQSKGIVPCANSQIS